MYYMLRIVELRESDILNVVALSYNKITKNKGKCFNALSTFIIEKKSKLAFRKKKMTFEVTHFRMFIFAPLTKIIKIR